jgi:hypothetical protein
MESASEEFEETDLKKIHINEPEARSMKRSKVAKLSYKGRAVADKRSGVIVAEKLVNQENDTSEQLDLANKRNYEVLTNPGNSERIHSLLRGTQCRPSRAACVR